MDYLYVAAGLILLVLGGDWLVNGAVKIALRFRMTPLVVGMTVVSFGTSAPELLVSLSAALEGFSDISFGNVIGSNIANISLVLGVTALIMPIFVGRQTYKVDFWVMTFATVILLFFLRDSLLVRWESMFLVLLLVAYIVFQIKYSKSPPIPAEVSTEVPAKLGLTLLILLGGIVALKFGSDLLVKGSVSLAQKWGMSERVIGLTVISIGTSLPELSASIIASTKGKQDISIGNLIGSNIFNILAVLGLTGIIIELPVQSSQLLTLDFPALLIIMGALILFMAFLTRGKITRWQGVVLFAGYILYLWLIL